MLPETVKPKLSAQAYQMIEEMVVTLKLAPGAIFSEAELSEQIGIGRTPLREALKRLETERLVISIPRRGIMVTPINLTDHLLLLETRRALDRLIAARAARRATAEQRVRLQNCAGQIYESAQAENLADYLRLDYELDELLTAAARNPFAAEAAAPLHAHSRRFWYAYRAQSDWLRIAELHAALLNRVAEGDEAQAAAASDELVDFLVEFTRTIVEAI
jgi:DNA-binding GntR family transcriptional regulator